MGRIYIDGGDCVGLSRNKCKSTHEDLSVHHSRVMGLIVNWVLINMLDYSLHFIEKIEPFAVFMLTTLVHRDGFIEFSFTRFVVFIVLRRPVRGSLAAFGKDVFKNDGKRSERQPLALIN